MAISADLPLTPAGVVAEAAALVASMGEVLWAAKTATELVDVVAQLEMLAAGIVAVQAGALAEIDARGIAKHELHWASTGDWFTHLAGLRRGEGRRRVEHAHRLVTDGADTRDALATGAVSPTQARVVLDAVENLPGDPMLRSRGEAHLLGEAARLNATDLARAGRHLAHVVDPDRSDRRLEAALAREERAVHAGRYLAIGDDGAGGVRLKGRGSAEDGAVLRAALLPLTAPTPRAPATDLAEPEGAQPDCVGVPDPRDHGARLWDALVTTAQHGLDTDLPPHTHGTRPRVALTLAYDDLQRALDQRLGEAVTEDGLRLSAAAVRRLACDADLIPIVLGTSSEVLDVGRRHRLITPGLWQALVARDRHCAFPGCTRPPLMCHAHHLIHWADGGPTSLNNLILVCGHHHRCLHETPWQARLNPRHHYPEFKPPPKVGSAAPEWARHRPRRE